MTVQQLAIIMGAVLLLANLPFIVNRKAAVKAYAKIITNTPLAQVAGFVGAVLAMLLLVQNFRISSDLAGVVALFSWLGLLESVLYVWMPDRIARFEKKKFLDNETTTVLFGLTGTVVGGWLLIQGLGL